MERVYKKLEPGQPLFNLEEQENKDVQVKLEEPKTFKDVYKILSGSFSGMSEDEKAEYLIAIERALTGTATENTESETKGWRSGDVYSQ